MAQNGGYLVFDYAEALTVIDVNTGKFVGKHSLSDTVFQTNCEAVTEIARQLRLRDIAASSSSILSTWIASSSASSC